LPEAPSYSSSLPLVVVVGASAGGLEALEALFANIPSDSGLAFVVIQHLSPDFKSLMNELLARKTKMEIHIAEEGMAVKPNAIFLNPPKKELTISARLISANLEKPNDPNLVPLGFHQTAQ